MTILTLLQKLFILANALYYVVFSDDLGPALDCIRRNTMYSPQSKGAVMVARDLLSCRQNLEDNAKLILGDSNFELQQMSLLCTGVNEQKKQISEETLKKVKSYVLSGIKELSLEFKEELMMNHILFDEERNGNVPDYEEIKRDNQASKALDALSLYIATLNVICSLEEQIRVVLNDVKETNIAGVPRKQLLTYLDNILNALNRSYTFLARLWKTSRYAINSKAIYVYVNTYKVFYLPDDFYRDVFKADPRFGVLPDRLTFRKKDGSLVELVS